LVRRMSSNEKTDNRPWWSERDPIIRAAKKAAATPAGDTAAQQVERVPDCQSLIDELQQLAGRWRVPPVTVTKTGNVFLLRDRDGNQTSCIGRRWSVRQAIIELNQFKKAKREFLDRSRLAQPSDPTTITTKETTPCPDPLSLPK
jgi:hypothetical protein